MRKRKEIQGIPTPFRGPETFTTTTAFTILVTVELLWLQDIK